MSNEKDSVEFINAGHFKPCDYFFTNQTVKANPHYEPDDSNECSDVSLNLEVELTRSEENPNIFFAQAKVSSDKDIIAKGDSMSRYEFEVTAFGRFEFIGVEENLDLRDQSLAYHAGLTCVQLLIGAARERIMELTSRGPWEKVCIQTVGIHILHQQVLKALQGTQG